jgi:TRAP-type C4-dicarboxylate transport system substrate-binding protein
VASLAASAAWAQTRWDLPTPYPESSFNTRNIAEFAKDVDGRTNGSLKITLHPNQSLIRHPDIKDAVRRGVVPLGELLGSRLENEHPLYALDMLPFLVNGYDGAWKLYQAQKPQLQKLLEREGIILLFSVPFAPPGLLARTEITAPAQLSGLKLRTNSKTTEQLAQFIGATAVPGDSELRAAFTGGQIDAAPLSAPLSAAQKAWEFAANYHDVQAWFPRTMVIMNKSHYDGLSDGERKALMDAGAAAEARGWEMSKAETRDKTELLAKSGMKVIQPSEALRQGLAEVGKRFAAEWLRNAGPEGKSVFDALAKR